MRRRRRPPESSLELLLDTICNTFGGVLFLSLTVAVLLETTGKLATSAPDPRLTAIERAELQTRRSAIQSEAEELRTALAARSALERAFGDGVSRERIERLRTLKSKREKLEERRRAAIDAIADATADADQAVQDDADLDRRLAETARRAKAAQEALKREAAARTRTARLPRLHLSIKREVGVVLRYGRLYVWHRYGANGERLGLNEEEFTVVEETPDYVRTHPKPYAGAPVVDSHASRQELLARLKRFPSNAWHVAVLVWPDSFEAFGQLQRLLVEHGYEYRLLLMGDGLEVMDRGGTDLRVQ